MTAQQILMRAVVAAEAAARSRREVVELLKVADQAACLGVVIDIRQVVVSGQSAEDLRRYALDAATAE